MTTDGLITTPFGFDSTAAEVVAGIDLTGKNAIVTGASSGIETARALGRGRHRRHSRGAERGSRRPRRR